VGEVVIMVEVPSVIWSEERIDLVLALANELDIGFGAALNLYRAGHATPEQVATLSIDEIVTITDLSRTAAERIYNRLRIEEVTRIETSIEVREEEPAEAKVEVAEPKIGKARRERDTAFDIPSIDGEPVDLDDGAKIEYGKYYHINPEMVKVWVLTGPVWFTLIMIIAMSPLVMLFEASLAILFGFVVAIVLLGSIWWAGLQYDNYTFAFTKDIIVVRSGVLYKEEVHIPFGRIQNINSHQGICDRMFGVWHLSVSATGATSMIHGVPQHEAVKAFILDNVDAVKAKRVPKVDSDQGYREVYVALKSISRNLQSHRSRAIVAQH